MFWNLITYITLLRKQLNHGSTFVVLFTGSIQITLLTTQVALQLATIQQCNFSFCNFLFRKPKIKNTNDASSEQLILIPYSRIYWIWKLKFADYNLSFVAIFWISIFKICNRILTEVTKSILHQNKPFRFWMFIIKNQKIINKFNCMIWIEKWNIVGVSNMQQTTKDCYLYEVIKICRFILLHFSQYILQIYEGTSKLLIMVNLLAQPLVWFVYIRCCYFLSESW